MKKTIITILFFVFSLLLFASEQQFIEANKQYNEGNYDEAIQLYEDILTTKNLESAAVYYNLGNAYFKKNKIAHAILNYERSLLLEPHNEKVLYNLELSKAKTVDKIDTVESFFIKEWIEKMANLTNSNTWAWYAVVSFWIFILLLFLYVFSRFLILKKTALALNWFVFFFCLFSFIFSGIQKRKSVNQNYAIIFENSVVAKSSPDESGTDLFLLHEGTKVKINSTFGNKEWVEIELSDGNSGWLKQNVIQKI